ncbi:MAG: MarR family winged helix-turn-helix transcriptional regulator [Acidimicrobiales bacterium]
MTPLSREAALDRFVELRQVVLVKMNESVPPELSAEFESITVHQLKALGRIPTDGLTMHQLAGALGISGATACALTDRLVAQGLALRAADPTDRRVVRLCLSPRGAELAERYHRSKREGVATLFAQLSDTQVVTLIEIMEAMAATEAPVAAVLAGSGR